MSKKQWFFVSFLRSYQFCGLSDRAFPALIALIPRVLRPIVKRFMVETLRFRGVCRALDAATCLRRYDEHA